MNTGEVFATSATQGTELGFVDWTNLEYIVSGDSDEFVSAVFTTVPKYTKSLLPSGFDFSGVPDAAVIAGMRLGIRAVQDGGLAETVRTEYIKIVIPGKSSSYQIDAGDFLSTVDWLWQYHGGATDLWGFTGLTGADLKQAGVTLNFKLHIDGAGAACGGYVEAASLELWCNFRRVILTN